MKKNKLALSLMGALTALSFQASASDLDVTPTIINGEAVALSEIPWQAKVRTVFERPDGELVSFLCGGSIISDSIILSAAHCFEPESEDHEVVAVTISYYSKAESKIKYVGINTRNIKVHPRWNGSVKGLNDVSVIYESNSAFADAHKIKVGSSDDAASMWTEFNSTYVDGQDNKPNVLTSGYGLDETGAIEKLNKIYVSGVSSSYCDDWTDAHSFDMVESSICAVSPDYDFNQGICSGDSGGPLIWQNPNNSADEDFGLRLVGITSYSTVDEDKNCVMSNGGYSAYSSIDYYGDWINEAASDLTGEPFDYNDLDEDHDLDTNPVEDIDDNDPTNPDNGDTDNGSDGDGGDTDGDTGGDTGDGSDDGSSDNANGSITKSGGSFGLFSLIMMFGLALTGRRKTQK
ncbi:trypsin-like serine protease [Vibrio harveyi]|uniref:trypsin-like serine protease n=1 Tax=Vibrio harveyi TaxID=669 RepID=UPI003CEEF18C